MDARPGGLSRGRAAAVTLLAALLVLPAGIGPALARLWGEHAAELAPRDAEIQRTSAMRAFADGKLPLALDRARRSLSAMPWNQTALAVVAASLQGRSALDALNLSASLGWRDPLTNTRLVSAAFAENQNAVAAERIDAIGRTLGAAAAGPLADRLLARPGGAEALSVRAARHLRDADWFLPWLTQPPADPALAAARTQLLRSIDSDDGTWRRRAVAQAMAGFDTAKLPDEALALWRDTLAQPALAGSTVYDPAFTTLGNEAPLGGEWALAVAPPAQADRLDSGAVQLVTIGDKAGQILSSRSDLTRLGGAVVARWEGDETAVRAFAVELRCGSGAPVPLSRALVRDGNGWRDSYAFALPAGCRTGYIVLIRADRAGAERSARLLRIDGGGGA